MLNTRPKIKYYLFPLPLPTQFFCSYPKYFIDDSRKKLFFSWVDNLDCADKLLLTAVKLSYNIIILETNI